MALPPRDAGTCPLKAEIQVRTLLEHAYADIGHDLTYKTDVKVPDRVHRSFSALAAILESADHEFQPARARTGRLQVELRRPHERKDVEKEIARIARRASGTRKTAFLRPSESRSWPSRSATKNKRLTCSLLSRLWPTRRSAALGTALTQLGWDAPQAKGDDFQKVSIFWSGFAA